MKPIDSPWKETVVQNRVRVRIILHDFGAIISYYSHFYKIMLDFDTDWDLGVLFHEVPWDKILPVYLSVGHLQAVEETEGVLFLEEELPGLLTKIVLGDGRLQTVISKSSDISRPQPFNEPNNNIRLIDLVLCELVFSEEQSMLKHFFNS